MFSFIDFYHSENDPRYAIPLPFWVLPSRSRFNVSLI